MGLITRGRALMKSKVWTAVAIIIAIIIPFYANLLTAYPYPAGWSDDFRITYGAEKGGAGRDLRFFDIAQDGDYFFVVQDGGRDYSFLTRINNEGIFIVKEKVLMETARGPSYVFLDGSRKLHYFYSPSVYPYEIAYLQFDENGSKVIDTVKNPCGDYIH